MSNPPAPDSGPNLSPKHHRTAAKKVSTSQHPNHPTPDRSTMLTNAADDVTAAAADKAGDKASEEHAKEASDMAPAAQKAAESSEAVT